MTQKFKYLWVVLILFAFLPANRVHSQLPDQFWFKIKAVDKFQRSVVADMGIPIEIVRDEYIYAIGTPEQKNLLEQRGLLEMSFPTVQALDFPDKDAPFHNYNELVEELMLLSDENPDIVTFGSIGRTAEGREIYMVRLGTEPALADQKPAVIFMGGHHAREHLSVEMPLMTAKYLVKEFRAGNPKVVGYLKSRDIHIIPAVNPDGLEYDVKDAKYKYWRKNRRKNADGTFGVDLNRNYGFKWGTGGSSKNTSSDVYMGTQPFSEPETQAIKNYIENHKNISVLLTFHTFSELILYPWGHKYEGIENTRAKQVHETMAKTMAQWNGYTPQQSSELYIASGDTTDWSYGQLGIISFTFELDPKGSAGQGGFYPGAGVIENVFKKNLNPILYLIDYADNPYRVIEPNVF